MPSCKICSPALSCRSLTTARYLIPKTLPDLLCECGSCGVLETRHWLPGLVLPFTGYPFNWLWLWARRLPFLWTTLSIKWDSHFRMVRKWYKCIPTFYIFSSTPQTPTHLLKDFCSSVPWLPGDLWSTGLSTLYPSALSCLCLSPHSGSFEERLPGDVW